MLLVKKKIFPLHKYVCVYASGVFISERETEKLLFLIPYILSVAKSSAINSNIMLSLSEAAIWEGDVYAFKKLQKYIDYEHTDDKCYGEYIRAIHDYIIWLDCGGDPPELKEVYEGFFSFRAVYLLMKATRSMHEGDLNSYKVNIAACKKYRMTGQRCVVIKSLSKEENLSLEKFREVITNGHHLSHVRN